MFNSILSGAGSLSITSALICIFTSLVLGLIIAIVHMKTTKYSKNFVITLAILPTLVELVIIMVNGNLGTSVAVLGAFSLIRFRSIPGNSREIISIFFAMAIGLSVGMGHILFAVLMTIIISVIFIILSFSKFGNNNTNDKILRITVPENLNYTNMFDDLFNKYTKKTVLEKVKTTNMGSMFELTYTTTIKDLRLEKEFIDELRCRNGNMKIVLERSMTDNEL